MSYVSCLNEILAQAKGQLAAIKRGPDYALEARDAESEEEASRLEECDRRQAKARHRVEQEIASLEQRIASMK